MTPTGALRAWWSLFIVLVTAVLIAVAGIMYTTHVQRQSDRRWCDLLATLDQPGEPAATERGRQIQQELRQLRRDLGCSGV